MKRALLFLVLATAWGAANATIWNACDDFSITSGNPNGVWSYGSKLPDDLGGGFVGTYVAEENANWKVWHAERLDAGTPGIGINISSSTINGIAPGELCLHPGSCASQYNDYLNQVATVRWTAPEDGEFWIYGGFGRGDTNYRQGRGDVDVYVYINGTCAFKVLETFNDQYYDITSYLKKGDTVDFMVGNGGGDFAWDSTPLYATIESVPEPFTMALCAGALGLAFRRRRRS